MFSEQITKSMPIFKRNVPISVVEQKDFEAVILSAEHDVIKKRREHLELEEGTPDTDAFGVALSGGGVRSATFNLGLLQALDHYKFLPFVDYLSTVSGGGYIGSSLNWFQHQQKSFPFPRFSQNRNDERAGRWLREHASYLTPGKGLDHWALAAAAIRGIFINLLIFLPLLLAFMYLLTWTPGEATKSWMTTTDAQLFETTLAAIPKIPPAFVAITTVGIGFIVWLALNFILYALASRVLPIRFRLHRRYSARYGQRLKLATVLVIFGVLPFAGLLLETIEINKEMFVYSSSFLGAISMALGWFGRKNRSETRGLRAFALQFGLLLLIYALFLAFYEAGLWLHEHQVLAMWSFNMPTWAVIMSCVMFSIVLGLFADINHVSMHRYYRNRLFEAYMPNLDADNKKDRWRGENFMMKDINIETTGGPFQIVNSNITTLGSPNSTFRQRGGDSFTFSPLYSGATATGFVPTDKYIDGEMSLATAFSISGAAVDPNTGATRSRPLAFIMSLLNVRLGFWLRNPNSTPPIGKLHAPLFWQYYVIREMLGWRMDEWKQYVHLSDGGHFENLGLYELIRRKCPYILVSDASADPNWEFSDLFRAIQRARADFGAEIELSIEPLIPDPDNGLSAEVFVRGTITYEDKSPGNLIYLKTTMCADLPAEVEGYQKQHAEFPDTTTLNQFFDEAQFEAYRELGFRIGERLCQGSAPSQLGLFR